MFIFFSSYCLFQKHNIRERKKHTYTHSKRERTSHWPKNAPNRQDSNRLPPRAKSSIRITHTNGRKPCTWAVICCLPGMLASSRVRGRIPPQVLCYRVKASQVAVQPPVPQHSPHSVCVLTRVKEFRK